IYRKTGALFEAGCRLAAALAGAGVEQQEALAAYGRQLGTAFQLIDDVLDYAGSADEIGKNIGDDLIEGKPTLPLIQAMRAGDSAQRSLIREAIEQGGLDRIEEVHAAVKTPVRLPILGASQGPRPIARSKACAVSRTATTRRPCKRWPISRSSA